MNEVGPKMMRPSLPVSFNLKRSTLTFYYVDLHFKPAENGGDGTDDQGAAVNQGALTSLIDGEVLCHQIGP